MSMVSAWYHWCKKVDMDDKIMTTFNKCCSALTIQDAGQNHVSTSMPTLYHEINAGQRSSHSVTRKGDQIQKEARCLVLICSGPVGKTHAHGNVDDTS